LKKNSKYRKFILRQCECNKQTQFT